MLRSCCILSIALLLGACSEGVDDAKRILDARLDNVGEIDFRNIETYPGGVVCGEYRASLLHAGLMKDYQRFLTVENRLYNPPRALDWELYCSETPAEVLLNSTGIGLYDSSNTDLARITADLASLDAALESYYHDYSFYPTKEQGLEALVSPPENLPPSPAYPKGGYLAAIPVDPWGRAYLYEEEQWGRTKGSFTITTLGADGIAGGSGKNADVSTAVLQYLRHIAIVLAQQ